MTDDASPGGRGTALRRILHGRVVRLAVPILVVVAIFAGVLPRITDYAGAWRLVLDLTPTETLVIAVLAVVNLISYAPLWMAAMPGLGWWRAILVEEASTAVANTVPAGVAFGVGTSATIYRSFGYSGGVITRGIALTGIWNNLVKLVMPVVALAGLALTGEVSGALRAAAVLGIAVLLPALLVLLLVLTHGGAGAALAGAGQRLARRPARLLHRREPTGWVAAVDTFRADSLDLVRHRWPHLTAAALGSHLALFALLLACIRLVDGHGSDVGWLQVLAVFSITRLVTMIPITPGALGVAELSYVAGLAAIGMDASAAGAAVLLFRFLTWFLPIPFGALALLLWRRTARPPLPGQAPSPAARA